MKKKTILVAAIAVMLVAALVVGGTLAYFTDMKSADNVFTTGGVKIQLNEQQRDGKGGLETFQQDKVLYPIVGSAQGEKDEYGMPTAKNYVDKMVSVTNTGKSDAYVRAYFAIPALLDDGDPSFNASKNILHFNFGNVKVGDTWRTTYQNEWIWRNDAGSWNFYATTMKDGVKYNVYYADYSKALAPNATTEMFVQGVYLDKDFNFDAGTTTFKGVDLNKITCPVVAVAVQAEGFDSAAEAITAAYGANFNPFAGK